MLADRHPRQAERLAALGRYGIMDGAPEKAFDDVVKLAARLCGVPMSLISLVDHDRQWFKAKQGLADAQTDLQRSICSHAILDPDVTEIPDTLEDPRTVDNPLVTGDPKLRFYAGAPLVTPDGLPLGTLCVLSDKPHRLDETQREVLRVLAGQVMAQLDLRRTLKTQEVLRHEMDHRVKNSLQTVLSVVRLYGRGITDEAAAEGFRAVERRLLAISELHAALHRSSVVERVDLADFLSGVIGGLQASAPDHVSIQAELGHATTTSERATAIAMVLSEFVANSIKHAFGDGRPGTVTIGVRTSDDGRIEMACDDDGGGKAEAKTVSKAEALGGKIIEAAAQQAGGQVMTGPGPQGYWLKLVI